MKDVLRMPGFDQAMQRALEEHGRRYAAEIRAYMKNEERKEKIIALWRDKSKDELNF